MTTTVPTSHSRALPRAASTDLPTAPDRRHRAGSGEGRAADVRPPARLVLAAILVSATILGLTGSTGVLVPFLADEYGVPSGTAAVLVVSATAVQFALSPVAGRLGDSFGPRRLVLAAGVAGATGFGALAWAPAPALAVPAYAAGVGTCGACVTIPLLSALTRLRGDRARYAVALFTGAAQAGSAVSAPALGMGLTGWGLEPACAVAFAAVLAVALVGAGLLPPYAPAARRSTPHRPGTPGPAELAQRPWLRRLFISDVLCSSSAYLSSALLPVAAVDAGLAPGRIGAVVSAATVGGLAGRVVVPLIVRPSLGAVRVAHLLLTAGTALWLTRPGPTGLLVVALAHGVAIGSWTVLENLTVARHVPHSDHGAVFGLLLLGAGLGVLVSVSGAWTLVQDVVPHSLLAASMVASLAGALVLRAPDGCRRIATTRSERPADHAHRLPRCRVRPLPITAGPWSTSVGQVRLTGYRGRGPAPEATWPSNGPIPTA